MRISELAAKANVPLSAVKYYQREGLMPEGQKTAPNQTSYDETHLQRIRLIRALMGVGGLSIAATKEVITALSTAQLPEFFEAAEHAISANSDAEAAPSEEAFDRITALARAQGWTFSENNPGLPAAARALDGLLATGLDIPDEYLTSYAASAQMAAGADMQALTLFPSPDQQAELMVIGSVLGDPLFAGLRRLAHQSITNDQYSPCNTEQRKQTDD